jgi:hypothetical protein
MVLLKWSGLAQEAQGYGEIVRGLPGARVILAEYAQRSGESVLAELSRCFDLAQFA